MLRESEYQRLLEVLIQVIEANKGVAASGKLGSCNSTFVSYGIPVVRPL